MTLRTTSLIPPKRRRMGDLIGRRNLGLLTPAEESELREMVAREGWPVARTEDLQGVVDRALGLIAADVIFGEA